MKNRINSEIWIILVIAATAIFSPPLYAQNHPGGFKPMELICKMQPGYSIDIINSSYGTVTKSQQPQTSCYLLMVPQGQDTDSLAKVIDARPDVAYCRPNYYLTAPEPFQRSQPFLDVSYIGDFTGQLASTTLQLATVQQITIGTGIRVAVIDGGVNFSHPEFLSMPGMLVSGWDYVDNDAYSEDEPGGSGSGHGTFVAGIVKLVAPGSMIYSYRVLDTQGIGDGYNIASAVLEAINDSCRVINLSLGMVGISDVLDDALKFAKSRNVMVVAAAGNDSTDNNLIFPFPASRMYCLAIAALDSFNIKADFSNYGTKIDVCAPGTRIYAPYLDTLYAWWEGTSFAAPIVSGAATLLYSRDPAITWDEVNSRILQTAINVDSLNPGLEGLLGQGLIGILAALTKSQAEILGDADGSGTLNLADIMFIINYLYRGGPSPIPIAVADVDCSGIIGLNDVTYLIKYLYKAGPAPSCP